MTALAISNVIAWFAIVLLAGILLAMVRQLGVLHERVAPAGALMLAKGLKVGQGVPEVQAHDLDGRAHVIGGPRPSGRAMLLMFVSPSCPVCKSLLPVLKSSSVAERDWLDIVLASDGDLGEHREFVASQRLSGFSYLVSAPLGIAYQVSRLPFAALIDAGGVLRARGMVNSREHLESLFEAKRLGLASLQEHFEAAARDRAA